MKTYELVIGIEIHVQLKTKTKIFCACDNDSRDAEPNTNICPVCLGLPGTLPYLNGEAVKLALRAGLALHGEIPEQTKFDRKNYFYPDLPKGYQITQFDEPIVGPGYVDVPLDGKTFRVGITRAHMEEDAGKLTHPTGASHSLVDLNRAGTPLLEIVSEPDIRSAAQAKAYAQEVYNLMRYADVSEANLYYGNMRFDVNVSVRPVGTEEFGTRTETKNLNSFRAVERSVEYEFKRQVEVIEAGGTIVQETRGWDDDKQQTFSQRTKSDAHDYRYFPEPDLPPVVVTPAMIDEAEAKMPIMPNQLRKELLELELPLNETEVIVDSLELKGIYLEIVKNKPTVEDMKRIVYWLIGQVVTSSGAVDLNSIGLDRVAKLLIVLSDDVKQGNLSQTAAKDIIATWIGVGGMSEDDTDKERAQRQQNSDTGELEKIIKDVMDANPKPVEDYRNGEAKALGFLVGQVMKASKGQANPQMVNELLITVLKR
jgi:aspartyl-tRNA(Asn)/glutamyl-tRNA(Gln) amidotransferase subunit B